MAEIIFMKKLEDVAVRNGKLVQLSCRLNVPMTVEWFKNETSIQTSANEAEYHCLTLGPASENIEGTYLCRCKNAETSCIVSVSGNVL